MTNEMDKFSKILKRKRRRRFLVFAFLFLLIIAAVVITSFIIFSINIIRIDNQTNYDTSEILKKAELSSGDFLLGIKEDKLKTRIMKEFPYVAEIDFGISYPDTLVMTFKAGKPDFAVEMADGTFLYLDDSYKILEQRNDTEAGVLVLKGMTVDSFEIGSVLTSDDSLEIEILSELLENLGKFGLESRVTSFDFSKKYNTIFTLDNRIDVEIGTSSDIDRKIELMVSILEKNKTDKKMNINVRNYTQGRCRILE